MTWRTLLIPLPFPPFNTHTGYPPFYSDDPLTTCRKIVNWRMFLKFPDEIAINPACKDLIQRLMCDVDDRLGTQGVQVCATVIHECLRLCVGGLLPPARISFSG